MNEQMDPITFTEQINRSSTFTAAGALAGPTLMPPGESGRDIPDALMEFCKLEPVLISPAHHMRL